jgi:mRNA interferase MazF
MKIRQYDIWTADLNPQIGTEPGKIRPVMVIQTDLLNSLHPSTIICPITTNVNKDSDILRVHIKKGVSNMQNASDLMIDQIRAIDNKRFVKKIGELPADLRKTVTENIKIVLDLE